MSIPTGKCYIKHRATGLVLSVMTKDAGKPIVIKAKGDVSNTQQQWTYDTREQVFKNEADSNNVITVANDNISAGEAILNDQNGPNMYQLWTYSDKQTIRMTNQRTYCIGLKDGIQATGTPTVLALESSTPLDTIQWQFVTA
ncbi:uncharacterized protein [Branchiostoma lanceolatum]|uniref:uncharacterized protein n=1 Tax=Branchiostoma lanceolatum TaxID=7740 RepID=UPI003454A5FA